MRYFLAIEKPVYNLNESAGGHTLDKFNSSFVFTQTGHTNRYWREILDPVDVENLTTIFENQNGEFPLNYDPRYKIIYTGDDMYPLQCQNYYYPKSFSFEIRPARLFVSTGKGTFYPCPIHIASQIEKEIASPGSSSSNYTIDTSAKTVIRHGHDGKDETFTYTESAAVLPTQIVFDKKLYDNNNFIPKVHPRNGMPKSVIFCIHGIGQRFKKDRYDFLATVQAFDTVFNNPKTSRTKHFIVPVLWDIQIGDVNVISESNPIKDEIETLYTDILYYLSDPKNSTKLNSQVISVMNSNWEKIKKTWPEFNGKITWIGHSLGSVIASEILTNRNLLDELKCPEPYVYFSMASPWPLINVLRNKKTLTSPEQSNSLSTTDTYFHTRYLFNLMNDIDPLAFLYSPTFLFTDGTFGLKVVLDLNTKNPVANSHLKLLNPATQNVDYISRTFGAGIIRFFKLDTVLGFVKHIQYFNNIVILSFIRRNLENILDSGRVSARV